MASDKLPLFSCSSFSTTLGIPDVVGIGIIGIGMVPPDVDDDAFIFPLPVPNDAASCPLPNHCELICTNSGNWLLVELDDAIKLLFVDIPGLSSHIGSLPFCNSRLSPD